MLKLAILILVGSVVLGAVDAAIGINFAHVSTTTVLIHKVIYICSGMLLWAGFREWVD